MNKTLPEVISEILTYNGGIIEKKKDSSLEVINPPNVSKSLSIPEYTQLYFSYEDTSRKGIYASYDSEFFNAIGNLLADKGKFCIAKYERSVPNEKKILKVIPDAVSLNNATFRLTKSGIGNISYLLIYLKYTALSDEKREGILPVLVNETTLSTTAAPENIISDIDEAEEEPTHTEKYNMNKVVRAAYSAGSYMAKEKLKDFIRSLERRLNRDIKRVHEYYETLDNETKKVIQKKILSQNPDFVFTEENTQIEKQIQEKSIQINGIDKLLSKLNAVKEERKWKIRDLLAKYRLTIKIEPVLAIRVQTQSIIFWIDIKRKLSSRPFPLTYNPMLRQLDVLPCESCFNPQKPYYICDNKLHIVCSNCFLACPVCGKQYCRMCYNNVCPKCKKVSKAGGAPRA